MLYEYENVDFPFRVFFDILPAVKASYKLCPEGSGLEISIGGDLEQRAANDLACDFLIGWNRKHNGLCVVVNHILPATK